MRVLLVLYFFFSILQPELRIALNLKVCLHIDLINILSIERKYRNDILEMRKQKSCNKNDVKLKIKF